MDQPADIRRCRCGARLAVDNSGALCGACSRSVRNLLVGPPAVPPEFWDHETVQEALANWHMGRLIRAFRLHPWHGEPIRQCTAAQWIHLDQTQLSRIENGKAPMDLAKLMYWAHTFRVPHDLLWFKVSKPERQGTPGDADTCAADDEDQLHRAGYELATTIEQDDMSPLSRRSLLAQGLAAAALPIFGVDELQHMTAALADAHRYLDGTVTDYFRRQLAHAKADDGALGFSPLPVVLGLLGAIERHARDVKPQVRRDLLIVGGEAAEFAGWLYRDGGDLDRALFWHDRASEWAQEAGDLQMQGYVLLRKAQVAYDEREPVRMLTLSQAVQTGPWQLPNRVRAEALQQEARADAMLGASTNAVQRKLDAARRLLHTVDLRGADTHLGAHYDDALLTMQTAVCYSEAGHPRRSIELYDDALTERTFSPRDFGFFQSWHSASLALAGEPDESAAVGLSSARRANDANSRRTRRELTRVLDRLSPWKNRPAVRQLQETLQAQRT